MASSSEQPTVREIENGKVEVTSRILVKGVSPDQIYEFFLNLDDERYRQWHPGHHLEFRTIHRPEGEVVGTISYFKERFADGRVLATKIKTLEVVPGRRAVQRSISPWWQPFVLIVGLEPTPEGTLVTHQIVAGTDFPILGKLFNLVLRRVFLRESNVQAIHNHANEEFTNLERLLKQ